MVTADLAEVAPFEVMSDAAQPGRRPGRMHCVGTHRVGRRRQARRALRHHHRVFGPLKRAGQPRRKTVRQQAERRVTLAASNSGQCVSRACACADSSRDGRRNNRRADAADTAPGLHPTMPGTQRITRR